MFPSGRTARRHLLLYTVVKLSNLLRVRLFAAAHVCRRRSLIVRILVDDCGFCPLCTISRAPIRVLSKLIALIILVALTIFSDCVVVLVQLKLLFQHLRYF